MLIFSTRYIPVWCAPVLAVLAKMACRTPLASPLILWRGSCFSLTGLPSSEFSLISLHIEFILPPFPPHYLTKKNNLTRQHIKEDDWIAFSPNSRHLQNTSDLLSHPGKQWYFRQRQLLPLSQTGGTGKDPFAAENVSSITAYVQLASPHQTRLYAPMSDFTAQPPTGTALGLHFPALLC